MEEDDQDEGHGNSELPAPSGGASNGDLWARAAALARRDLERAQARASAPKPAQPRAKKK
jgi:hypothetical protein